MNVLYRKAAFNAVRSLLCLASCCVVVQSAHASEEFFVPLPEDETLSYLRGIYSEDVCTVGGSPAPADTINTVTDFVVRVEGTVIVIDHHEDGYESDIEGIIDEVSPVTPDSLTTRIYGDGILSNGAAPGVTTDAGDALIQGQVVVFEERITVATQLNDIEIDGQPITGGGTRTQDGLDGGDRVFASDTINVTRSQWADGPGTLLAGAFELFPISQWGDSFTLPVGEDSNATEFEWTGLTIMAANDGTEVSVDANADGDFNDVGDVDAVTIGRGETIQVRGRNDEGGETTGGLNQGARVFSSDIVQVNTISGQECTIYSSRWFTLFPDALLGNNYYEPVSTGVGNDTVIYLYNPSPTSIVINYETAAGVQPSIIVLAGEVFRQVMPDDSGARFFTGTNATFGAFTVTDEGGAVFDWGHASTSERLMGNIVQVGFAEGDDPSTDLAIGATPVSGQNAAPIWLVADNLIDTSDVEYEICVDVQGDGGPNTDPNTGLTYDFTFTLDRLDSARVYDGGRDTPNAIPAHIDDDQSGMQIFVCDGSDAILAAAWGQDPINAAVGQPAVDVGTTVRSVSAGVAFAGDTVFEDVDGDGIRDPGEPGIRNVTILLTPPPSINLGNGPGRPITATTDFNGSYLFPSLVDASYTIEVIPPEDFVQTFDPDATNNIFPVDNDNQTVVTISDSSGRLDQDFGYQNNVTVGDVGDLIYSDLNGNGIQEAGELGIAGINVELCTDVTTDLTPINFAGDDFNTQAYDNNSADWAGDWTEINDDGSPTSATNTNQGFFITGGGELSVRGNANGPSLSRSVDLTGVGSDTLSLNFDWRGANDTYEGGDQVFVQVSLDGGISFTTIRTITGAEIDNQTGSESLSFFTGGSTSVDIRFEVNAGNFFGGGENLFIDNLEVASLEPASCQTVVTGADGSYSFTGVPDGLISVEVLNPPSGQINTDDPNGDGDSRNIFLLSNTGGNLEQDFGYFVAAIVIGRVYEDTNGNGVQDVGESGVANLNVEITDSSGDLIVVVTDANGDYSANVAPGTTQVNLDQTDPQFPFGFIQTDGEDPTTVVAVAGITVDAGDDGFFQGNVIGDTVYYEVDGVLGAQGLTDIGIPNTVVSLTPPVTIDLGAGIGVAISTTTDAGGSYSFVGLPDGQYVINVIAPSNSIQTDDPDGVNDSQSTLTVFGGVTVDDQDFGYQNDVDDGQVGDTVYDDLNGNGIQDLGEPGIENINVELCGDFDDDNSTVNTCRVLTTDVNGSYLFGDQADGGVGGAALPVSDVGEVFTVTILNPPTGATNSQDPDGGLSNFAQFSLSVVGGNLDQDFGYFQPGFITGHLYIDTNGDGNQQLGEPDLAAINVTITDSNGNQQVVVSDSNGNYSASVAAGTNVIVDVDQSDPQFPANNIQTQGIDPDVLTVVAGLTTDAGDDGFAPAGEVSGSIFFDQPTIGTFEVGSDIGVSNVLVSLTPLTGQDLGNGIGIAITTLTDSNGNYSFGSLPDGDYVVDVSQPSGTNGTVDPNETGACGVCDNSSVVTISAGSIINDQNFGYESIVPSGQVGNFIFTDSNANGVFDSGEPGIAGINVQLCGDLDGDDLTAEECRTEVTGSDGQYLFGDGFLADGVTVDFNDSGLSGTSGTEDYTITVLNPPAGQSNTADPDGGTSDVAQLTLPAGIGDLSQNFGYVGSTSVSGTVWLDEDLDGIFDIEEARLTDVQVQLISNGVVIATVVSDGNGAYDFSDVFPGDYTIQVVETSLASGLTNTAAANNTGFDLNPKSISITPNQQTADVNFGYIPSTGTGAIGDRVWSDANGNGLQDSGEAGIAGVTLTLLDANGVQLDTAISNANGDYLFTSVAFANDLTVAIDVNDSNLTGFNATDGLQSEGSFSSKPIELRLGSTVLSDVDFGFDNPLTNTINEAIWFDDNGDGLFGFNESPIEGVLFNLFNDQNGDGIADDDDANGQPDVIATAASDSTGNVSFTGLNDGLYVVGLADSTQILSGLSGTTSQSQTRLSNSKFVSSASTNTETSFGFNNPGLVAGIVYADTSSNSDQDTGEAGLSGVLVTLTPSAAVDLGNGLGQPITTLTDSDGSYAFSVLPNQTYMVTVASPGGSPTEDPDGGADNTATVTLASGESSTVNDFGYSGVSNLFDLSGTVFFDNDRDGVLDTLDDGGIESVTVSLLDLGNINRFNIIDGMLDINGDGVISAADDGVVEGVDIIDGMFDVNGNGSITETDTGAVGPYDVLDGMVNLAQAGTATLSSVLGGLTADLANDGDTGNFAHTASSVSATDTEYWEIDLGSVQVLNEITVFNRDSCCEGRLEGVVLMVSDTPFPAASSDFAGALANADFTSVLSISGDDDPVVSVDISGRYVRLQKGGGNTVGGVVVDNFGNGAVTSGAGRGVINFAELKVTPSFIAATSDGVIATFTTGASGDYAFTGLPEGNYRVVVADDNAVLAGHDLTSGLNQVDVAVSTANVDQVNFGYVTDESTGSISGEVFIDTNGDNAAGETETNLSVVDVYLCTAPLLSSGSTAQDNVLSFERYDGNFSNTTAIDSGLLTLSATNDVFELQTSDLVEAVDDFGYIYRGFITLSETGSYEFSTTSDDGSVIFIDGMLVVDNDALQAPTTVSAMVTLEAGVHSIEVRYFESGGGQDFSASYRTPTAVTDGDPLVTIPSSILSSVSDVCNPVHPNFVAAQITDARGQYVFSGLPAAQYVVETDPNDIPLGLDQSTPEVLVNVTEGEDVQEVVIGHQEATGTAVLSGFVWTDADGNGLFEAGELPIPGVTINVFDNLGVAITSTVTDSSGHWVVSNLTGSDLSSPLLVGYDDAVPAALALVETQPTNLPFGDTQYFPVDVSDVDNRIISELDFGFQPTVGANLGSISGTIYADIDQSNNYIEAMDTELQSVTLNLINSDGDIVSTVRTDENGDYSFDGLPDDIYTIVVSDVDNVTKDLNASALDSIDSSITIDVANRIITDQNAGFISNRVSNLFSIGDKFFFDSNNNSEFDEGESGVEGVTIECWFDTDLSESVNNASALSSAVVPQPGIDNLIRTVVTDQNGDFLCPSLPAGQYIVRVLDAGAFNEADDGASVSGINADNQAKHWSYALALDGTGPDFSADFAIAGDNSISGFIVIEDMDLVEPLLDDGLILGGVELDGVRDGPSNDTPAGGVTVDLFVEQSGALVLLQSTVTASDGSYSFINLPDGDYQVVVSPSGSVIDGFGQTGDPSLDPSLGLVLPLRGGVDNGDEDLVCDSPTASLCDDRSEIFTLSSGTTVADLDFAYQRDFATTPVTMTYFSSTGSSSSIEFIWETENEIGHAGFQLYARIDGQWQLISDLIGSEPGSALMIRSYQYSVSGIDAQWFALIDVSSQEEVTPHGPFKLGQEYGQNTVELEPYDWSRMQVLEPSDDEISIDVDARLQPLLDAQERAYRQQ